MVTRIGLPHNTCVPTSRGVLLRGREETPSQPESPDQAKQDGIASVGNLCLEHHIFVVASADIGPG